MSNSKSPIDLPFVGRSKKQSEQLNYWLMALHAKDYLEGTKQGALMATAYLQYLRDNPGTPPLLPQIVADMNCAEDGDGARGQINGFLSTVEAVVVAKITK